MGDWTSRNIYILGLLTAGYVFGEIAHFLLGTNSKHVANSITYIPPGPMHCVDRNNASTAVDCTVIKDKDTCLVNSTNCEWLFTGGGDGFQILVNTAFINTFSVSILFIGFALDKASRPLLTSVGMFVFSSACLLMGFSTEFWQLVVLRMCIALGEAVCRPAATSIIADLFSPNSRGVANGVFSWGIYFGYGMAFFFGITMIDFDSDVSIYKGEEWRTSYILAGAPGMVIAILIFFTIKDPRNFKLNKISAGKDEEGAGEKKAAVSVSLVEYLKSLKKAFLQPAMILLLLAAATRHIAGLAWANNNVNYYNEYFPGKEIGHWIMICSIVGGSFGVFSGGYITDILQKRFGLASRLWVQCGFLTLALPCAVLTLYLPPPFCFIALLAYYFCAETWFAILFTVLSAIVPPDTRAFCTAFFLFFMNLVAGNLVLLVETLGKAIGNQASLYIFFPGMIGVSGLLFFLTSIPLWNRQN